MRTWSALPDASLTSAQSITAAFLKAGVQTYRDAASLVYRLPYGRTSSRVDFMAVLIEGRGTCSSKHAVLAELVIEQQLPVALMLGIYLMNKETRRALAAYSRAKDLGKFPKRIAI